MRNEDEADQLHEGEGNVQVWATEEEIAASEIECKENKFRVSQDLTADETYWISDSDEYIEGDYESDNEKYEKYVKELISDDEICSDNDGETIEEYESKDFDTRLLNNGNVGGELEEKIIEFVKKNSILYNKGLRSYRNSTIKYKLWSNLAIALDTDVMTCKTRWKSLRDRYVRELRKQQQPIKSETNSRVTWPYFESLSFLEDSVRPSRCANKNVPQESRGEIVMIKTPKSLNSQVEMLDKVSLESGPSHPKRSRQQVARQHQDLTYRFSTCMEVPERTVTPQFDSTVRHKHFGFLEMLKQQLEQLPDDICDDIKIEILIWVHEKLKGLRDNS